MKKDIIFVIGPPNTGKTYYINKYLQDYYVVDLFDFQKYSAPVLEYILQSYKDCADALTEACKKYDKVVLEHTLMKRKRRPQYIKAVQDALGKDAKITCLYTNIDIETYKKYDLANLKEYQSEDKNNYSRPESEETLKSFLRRFDKPTKEEGFNKIKEIKGE